MKFILLLTLLLGFHLKAADIDLLKEENADLQQLLESVSKKTGKQLQLKCELPKEKRHWLFINSSLNEVLDLVSDQFPLFYSVSNENITINNKLIPQSTDLEYSVLTNDIFSNQVNQQTELLEILTRACSNVKLTNKTLTFISSKKEYSALIQTLKVLGYVDVKREILTTLRIKKSLGGADHEFKVKNTGQASAKLPGKLNDCLFEVFNTRFDQTGKCIYEFRFTSGAGVWSQKFSDDLNRGQIEIAPNIYAETFSTYILDGENVAPHNFPISKISSSIKKHKNILGTLIPAIKIEDQSLEQTVIRLQRLLNLPISVAYSSRIPKMEIYLDPQEATQDIAKLNLDVEEIPIGEFFKYCTDHWGMNYLFTDNKVNLFKTNKEKTQRKALSHTFLNRSLYRIPDIIWKEKKEDFLKYQKSGDEKKPFKEFLEDVFFSFMYKIEILEVFEEQKTVLLSGFFDVPELQHELSQTSIQEIQFPSEKAFNKFKFKAPSRILAKHISSSIINKGINKATNISILETPGKTQKQNSSLEYSKNSLKYFSKENNRTFEFKHGKPIYIEIKHDDGKVTVVFQSSKFEFKEPFPIKTQKEMDGANAIIKNLNVKDTSLEEVHKIIRQDYSTDSVLPLILRIGPYQELSSSTALEADPFAEADPFEDIPDSSKDADAGNKVLDQKFSLNLQNFSTYDFYSSLAYMFGLKIHFDNHAVIIQDNLRGFCCGVTRFYPASKDIIEQLDWLNDQGSDGGLPHEKDELFLSLYSGETITYLDRVERLIVTSSLATQRRVKAILDILDKELKTLKTSQSEINILNGSSVYNNDFQLTNNLNNLIIKSARSKVSFSQSTYKKELLEHSGRSWADKIGTDEKEKQTLLKLKIPEISFDSPNLNSVLFQLSNECQKLKFPNSAINIIGPLYGTSKAYKNDFKDISVWELLSRIAKHYELDVMTSADFSILSTVKHKYHSTEVRLITLEKNISSRKTFLQNLSSKAKRNCLFLSIKESKLLNSPDAERTELDLTSKCRFKFLKNTSKLIIYGIVPQLNFIEKELRQKNLISDNKDLDFSLLKDNREIYRFNQKVGTNAPVKITHKDGWELTLVLGNNDYKIIFNTTAGNDIRIQENIEKLGTLKLTNKFSIKIN